MADYKSFSYFILFGTCLYQISGEEYDITISYSSRWVTVSITRSKPNIVINHLEIFPVCHPFLLYSIISDVVCMFTKVRRKRDSLISVHFPMTSTFVLMLIQSSKTKHLQTFNFLDCYANQKSHPFNFV